MGHVERARQEEVRTRQDVEEKLSNISFVATVYRDSNREKLSSLIGEEIVSLLGVKMPFRTLSADGDGRDDGKLTNADKGPTRSNYLFT